MSEHNPYESPNTEPPATAPESSDLTTVDWVIAILCSVIGCIIGVIRVIEGKPSGGKMLLVSVIATVVWNVIQFVVSSVFALRGVGAP